MYGSRARIGLIVPASNTVCEQEMAVLCPEGVATYATRILFKPTVDGLRRMKNHVERAASELSSEGVSQLIAFCCTVASLMNEREIIDLIEKKSGVPSITASQAVVASFQTLKVKKIAIATPYHRVINQLEKKELERQGFEVTEITGYHESFPPESFRNEMIGQLLPEAAYEMGLKVNGNENEAIFISCTNFRTIEIIEKLENETGKPVIASNQATIWHALRKLGLKDSIKGYGHLLEKY